MAKEKLDKKEAFSRATKAAAERTRAQPKKTITAGRRSAGRITSVPLSQIVLDRYQPRPILPIQAGLRDNFFAGKADWKKTAGQWMELSKSDTGIATQVNGLLEMGKSIGELNQIEPATGAWTEPKPGIYKLLLSTGERRFWSLALSSVSNNQGEPQLAVQEIGPDELSLARQIVENESAKPLSAIGKARAIAGLILESLGPLPPELDRSSDTPPTDYEYYRSALDIEKLTGSKYMPRGRWEEIGEIMGMERPYMVAHINLLKLPEDLQYLADINELTEGVLREILNLPPTQWPKVISLAAKKDLTAPEIKRINSRKGKKTSTKDSPANKAASRLKSFWKITRDIKTSKDIEQVATDFVVGLDKKEMLAGADVLESLAKKIRLRAGD
jgi:ParB-like chromosome segregation protein Spo0J